MPASHGFILFWVLLAPYPPLEYTVVPWLAGGWIDKRSWTKFPYKWPLWQLLQLCPSGTGALVSRACPRTSVSLKVLLRGQEDFCASNSTTQHTSVQSLVCLTWPAEFTACCAGGFLPAAAQNCFQDPGCLRLQCSCRSQIPGVLPSAGHKQVWFRLWKVS